MISYSIWNVVRFCFVIDFDLEERIVGQTAGKPHLINVLATIFWDGFEDLSSVGGK